MSYERGVHEVLVASDGRVAQVCVPVDATESDTRFAGLEKMPRAWQGVEAGGARAALGGDARCLADLREMPRQQLLDPVDGCLRCGENLSQIRLRVQH